MRKNLVRVLCVISVLLAVTALAFTACAPMERNVTGFAMGSSFSVDYSFSSDLSQDIRSLLAEIEESFSATFDPSCVSRINQAEAGVSVSLSEEEFFALTRAFSLAEETENAFDPAILPLVKAWGFDPPYLYNGKIPPSSETRASAMLLSDPALFSLDEASFSISKSNDGAKLDLGGAMKGYAAEKVRDLLLEKGVSSALVNVGRTIAAVGEDVPIGVAPPRESAEDYILSFVLKEGEICATSGDYERNYESDGVLYHHILDVSTGAPASSDLIAATVISKDGMLADAYATAAVVFGSEKATALLRAAGARAILITREKKLILCDVEVKIKDASYVIAA
ncbi:MAG: FAD:protein FMN transferase [Clostridia bacterium]|nr:FAD:protein FMN transferase [Clostridia bacterium]